MATEALPSATVEPITNPPPANTAADKPKKTKEKKTSNLHARSTHPTYLEMIGEAISSLKERTGSSQFAIAKFIEAKHKAHLPSNFSKVLLVQLRRFAASGKLTRVKNSYKLPATTKKPAVTAPSKATTKVALAKPKPKAGVATKPKKKVTVTAKPKAAVKVSKPKPKTVAAKPNRRPVKVAKSSAKDAPAKKVAPAKKAVAAPKTTVAAAKTTKRASSGKSAGKVLAKKISARKAN